MGNLELSFTVGMQTGAATVESSMELPQKIKSRTALWPSDSASRNLSEITKNTNLKEYMHPYVHGSIIYNSQDLEAPKCPLVDEWIKKLWYMYTIEYYLAIKKKEISPFGSAWMDPESIMPSEISHWRKTSTVWFHSYVEYSEQNKLKNKIETNL